MVARLDNLLIIISWVIDPIPDLVAIHFLIRILHKKRF